MPVPEDGGPAFVPPKTEPVRYVRGFAGRPNRPAQRRHRRRHRLLRGTGRGPGCDQVPPARLGPVAATLLGLPDPGGALRCLRRGAREEREPARSALPYDENGTPIDFSFPGNPLDRHPTWRDCACPSCGARHGARPTRWTPLSIRRGISPASPRRVPTRRPTWPRRILDERRPVYRRHRARDPAPALFALLRPGDARSAASARKVRRSRSTRCSRRAW